MNKYRFNNNGITWEREFDSDQLAFEYCAGITDGPPAAGIEKLVRGMWYIHDPSEGCWRSPVALWFSRHDPTPEQLKEIQEMGLQLVQSDALKALASKEINDEAILAAIFFDLMLISIRLDAKTFFGVFPAPMQSMLNSHPIAWGEYKNMFYSAWNVKRTKEGSPATFQHYKFVLVGKY